MRYSILARELLDANAPEYDREQLEFIEKTCAHIAFSPARTMPEALQMTWFMLCFMDYDSFGRYDQYIYPYYQKSRAGGMNDDEALLWLKYAWIKHEQCNRILNMTIGGHKPDGSYAANELTALCLRATRETGFRSPNLTMRVCDEDGDELLSEACRVIGTGVGLPAMHNDRLFTGMLLDMGYPAEVANDYCFAGCSQLFLPGLANFSNDVGCYNPLKALELALRDGFDINKNNQLGPRTGSPASFDTYEKFKNAYDIQMRYMTRLGAEINDKDFFLRRREGACVRSLLVHDCLERGRGIFNGGARYYAIENEAAGLTNTANALYAIKKLVYGQKVVSLEKLEKILADNWNENEDIRMQFLNKAEKFGNDSDEVDEIRASITDEWYKYLQSFPSQAGGAHWPGEVGFVYHINLGRQTHATPDGRLAGEPLSSSAGASTGTDLSGPTALLSSMAKIDQSQCRTCCVLNIRFTKNVWNDSRGRTVEMIRTYFNNGGAQMQVNVVSQEELEKAVCEPDKYSDLVVRVGGFSYYFTRLEPDLQNEIINRIAQS